MFLFQIYLIAKGLTTYEHLKKVYKEEKNPFNEGILTNLKKFLKNKDEIVENNLDKLVTLDYLEKRDQYMIYHDDKSYVSSEPDFDISIIQDNQKSLLKNQFSFEEPLKLDEIELDSKLNK